MGKAIYHLTQAIELQPDEPKYYRERAKIFRTQRKYQPVADDIEQLVRLKAVTAEELNEIAWRYSTHPDATLRNGKKAVQLATQACEMTDFEDYRIVDTLAAAYAESGDFASAESYQQQAIDQLTDYYQRQDCEARLRMYRLKQPYRENPR
jgi:tetratricopeptide (TPR) repeat protein